jgi:hypothetical protein
MGLYPADTFDYQQHQFLTGLLAIPMGTVVAKCKTADKETRNMDNRDRSGSVLKLVNLARAAYGAPDLKSLLIGQRYSASLCPIGRSLRRGVEDWLFVAVGCKYLRLWALGRDLAAIVERTLTVWGIPRPRTLLQEKSDYVILALPAEIREFIDRFDRGLLPDYQGEVDEIEMRRLRELARSMPILVGRRDTRDKSHGKSQRSPAATGIGTRVEDRPDPRVLRAIGLSQPSSSAQ